MSVLLDGEYDRERLALYVTGLLPDDADEGLAVLALCSRLLPVLIESRSQHPEHHRERDEVG